MERRSPRWITLGATMLACLLGWLFMVAPVAAQAPPPSIEELASALEESATLVEQGDLASARARLRALDEVLLDEQQSLTLASRGWLTLLEGPPAEAAPALRRAAAALRAERTPLPPDARARLDEVLAREIFQPAQPSLWQRFLWWLQQFWPEWSFGGSDLASTLLTWLVVLFGVLVVSLVLVAFLRGLRRHLVEDDPLNLPPGQIPLHASDAQRQASDAATTGDFRQAMRLLYLAAILHLDEVGLLRFDPALTNREVLASVAHDAPLRALLAPVVIQFDRVWYGHAPFGQNEFEQVRAQIERLRTLEATS